MVWSRSVAPRASLCSFALLALFGLACETSPANAPPPDAGAPAKKKGELPEVTFADGPIAKVNGVEIPRKAFDTYYNRFRISMHKQAVLYPVGGAEAVMEIGRASCRERV